MFHEMRQLERCAHADVPHGARGAGAEQDHAVVQRRPSTFLNPVQLLSDVGQLFQEELIDL